jgi:dipeptidyl aminopeptidase/acylaminoacyl peptidase
MYEDRDAQPALARVDTYGLRLVKNIDPQPAESYALVKPRSRDYSIERPVEDPAFAVAANLYAYDAAALNARVERTEEAPDWRREIVTFDAAYGNERITASVYLPRTAPPHQVVIYFPGADATMVPSSRVLNLHNVDFVIRSGRALIWPVYKGTYERNLVMTGPNAVRDVTVQRSKDIRRTIDYVESRADLDGRRIGYYGVSLGAYIGILTSAIEPRFKATVLLGGGLARGPRAVEIDPLNFASRIRVPTLMVNGDSDYQNPLQASQLPLFRALTLPPEQKRHALFAGGHMPASINDVIREILDWYDRFLGPVGRPPVLG